MHWRSHATRIFRVTRKRLLKIQIFWMLRCVHWEIVTDVSEVRSAVIFKVKQSNQSSLDFKGDGTAMSRNAGNSLAVDTV